jgi:DNA-binding GntR family transcriptional regulator
MTGITAVTKTEAALSAIRERIRTGQLVKGERIAVSELAAELGMSLTPVREALRVLSADGLVEIRSHRGVVIADTQARHEEVWGLRARLEPYAVELAVPRLDAASLAELERLHSACARGAARFSSLYGTNRDWHLYLYEAAQQPILLSFIRRLWEVLPWRTVWAIPGRAEKSTREHDVVMRAIRAGDAVAAAEAMREHILSAYADASAA